MAYIATIRRYLRELQAAYIDAIVSGQYTDEMSFRPPLDTLLKGLARDLNPDADIAVILEPRNQANMGRPDWRIHDRVSLGIFGYIEAKGPSETPFDITPYRNQIQRYLNLGHNLVITDGIEFVFCMRDRTAPVVISLIEKSRMGFEDWTRLAINPQFELFMRDFYSSPSPQRLSEEQLVENVALRTRNLADDILAADIPYEQAMNDTERDICFLFSGIKELIYNHNDLTMRNEKVFADFVSQVIMFSLLYAHRVLCASDDSPSEKENKIREFVTTDLTDGEVLYPFRNLMVYLRANTDGSIFINQWIDECIKFLSFVKMTDQQLMNPDYHRLFELFLAKYDSKTRFDYGAFYTPQRLASFVVKLVNEIVNKEFEGLSIYENGNTIIDPCCGTGSFLEQVIRHDPGDANYNLCGFEILPTPYMLANYRMAVINKQLDQRRHNTDIVLANTLCNGVFGEEVNENSIEGRELKRASELSSMPLKLIIGNPPSSDTMRENNSNDFTVMNDLLEDFRPPVERRKQRQNIQKQVANPFMQFIRWSCKKLLDSQNHSVLAFVVPLSFLDAESYQYARKYLCENFSSAWVVAIDADARTGVRTDSLFNTLQGRAVIVLTHNYGVDERMETFHFVDHSQDRKTVKEAFLAQSSIEIINEFVEYDLDERHFKLLPVEPIDEDLYERFLPIYTEDGGKAVFRNHCSGIKLGGTNILTNVKEGMLLRRTSEIAANGILAVESWLKGSGQRMPDDAKIRDFQDRLNRIGNARQRDIFVAANICNYSFRPYVTTKVLLWKDMLQSWKDVGGGGTRYRGEIMTAYDDNETIGFSVAHAPKDINSDLGQFVSFCWYYPDNDLCSRGNGHIYMNRFPAGANGPLVNNINPDLCELVMDMTGHNESEAANDMVFYSYAVLCSQIYLEKFKGALYTPNQSDARARIPVVNDVEIFNNLVILGKKLANLEKEGHEVDNLLRYDYAAFRDALPRDFKMSAKSPFDELSEELILIDGDDAIRIPCPLHLQKLSIAGYETIKTWLKFNSYASTRCTFTVEDMDAVLDFLNSLEMHVQYVASIDAIVRDIIENETELITL